MQDRMLKMHKTSYTAVKYRDHFKGAEELEPLLQHQRVQVLPQDGLLDGGENELDVPGVDGRREVVVQGLAA